MRLRVARNLAKDELRCALLRLAVLIPILTVALLISGCERPLSTDNAHVLALKSKCRQDGLRVQAEWKARYHGETWSSEDEYAYNPQLNTCLWSAEYWGPSLIAGEHHVKLILDVYANR